MPAITLNDILEEAHAQLPGLSRALLNSIQDELKAKPQHFLLQDPWRRLQHSFMADFESSLRTLLDPRNISDAPLQAPSLAGLNSLSLVDERQALQDVAIAHVITTVEQHCLPELHQLGNFFAALRGTARARKNDNPLRPGLFAQALLTAFSSFDFDAERRYGLMQAAATPLAEGLHRLYAQLCAKLRAAEVGDLLISHASNIQDKNADLRFIEARRITEPATLDGLARRVHQRNTQAAGLDGSAAAEPVFIKVGGRDLLSRLYEQILADPRLLPPLKALLARLQVAVVRLSRTDTSLLHRQDHPTWRLLNRVAAHGMAFERPDDEALQSFLHFMDGELPLLIDSATISAVLFQTVLDRVDAHISTQVQQRSKGSVQALASLEREQSRSEWLQLLNEQIRAQIVGAPLGPRLLLFLQTQWPKVITQAMVTHGPDAEPVTAWVDWVDRLLDSLRELPAEADRIALRQKLPALIDGFRQGCESIGLAQSASDPVLQELMQLHGRILRGLPALPPGYKLPPQAAPQGDGHQAPTPEAQLTRLLEERESRQPDHWTNTKVDRGQLPTVPVQLYDQPASALAKAAVAAWMDGLQVGNWYHLFSQGEWLTAQVAWVSESKQFYLLVGQDPEERRSLTRGAIEKLLANGLITILDESSLVQRAVDTLMQDLDEGGG
ncbi:DUF1631 family protein [Roseateles sp. PN1]|uniref:DUF1631 family protein n=1 Tax=Roseateles sp. PN1 TaxID=3137372 RepID=UPI003139C1D6